MLSGCNLFSDEVKKVVNDKVDTVQKGNQKDLIQDIDDILGERESVYAKMRPALDGTTIKNLKNEFIQAKQQLDKTKQSTLAKAISEQNVKLKTNFEKRMSELEALKKQALALKKQPNAKDPLAKKAVTELVALLDKEILADGVLVQMYDLDVAYYNSIALGTKPIADNWSSLKQQQQSLEQEAKTTLAMFNQSWDDFHFKVTGKHTIKKGTNPSVPPAGNDSSSPADNTTSPSTNLSY